jgi:hypothetical protein
MVEVRLETCPRQEQRVQRAYVGCGRLVSLQKILKTPYVGSTTSKHLTIKDLGMNLQWWEKLGVLSTSKVRHHQPMLSAEDLLLSKKSLMYD